MDFKSKGKIEPVGLRAPGRKGKGIHEKAGCERNIWRAGGYKDRDFGRRAELEASRRLIQGTDLPEYICSL